MALINVLTSLFIVHTLNTVGIEFDPEKRARTLAGRGLDFVRAAEVFAGLHVTAPDLREDYGEERFVTIGKLDARVIVIVWTPRAGLRRIISMRKANGREKKEHAEEMG